MKPDDIQNLNYSELSSLRSGINERMKEMREIGITQLRATIAEQAELLGVEAEDLIPKKGRKRRRQSTDEGAALD